MEMSIKRSAYRIEKIWDDSVKTHLLIKNINTNEELKIGLNNEDRSPYNLDTNQSINVLCKVKVEKADVFLSGYRLFPPAGTTTLAGEELYSNEVFPLVVGEILIIESSNDTL